MKHAIKIPKKIKVGGMDYSICRGKEVSLVLLSNHYRGTCDSTLRQILLSDNFSKQDISATFIHEVMHAVDKIYLADRLEEETIASLAFGVHQVLEGLGIRFGL